MWIIKIYDSETGTFFFTEKRLLHDAVEYALRLEGTQYKCIGMNRGMNDKSSD